MTREEIEELKGLAASMGLYDDKNPCKRAVVLGKAIEALEQEPCIDAISREELLKAIDTWDKFGYTETGCFVREPKGDYVPYIHYDDVINCIKGMPPVIPAEKVGRWKRISMDKYSEHAKYWYRCDRCGEDNLGNTNYCPNCRAKMQEVEE